METAARLGFRLPDFTIATATPPDAQRACFRARKVLEEIVYDTVALENNPFTLPEVKTLIEGVTVGGHKIEDAQQVLNQAQSWRRLLHEVATGTFVPFTEGLDSALRLHALAAKEEALEWGKLRRWTVSIAGTSHEPPAADTLQSVLPDRGARTPGREMHSHPSRGDVPLRRTQPTVLGRQQTHRPPPDERAAPVRGP